MGVLWLSLFCYAFLCVYSSLPHGAMGLSAVCDCGISCSNSLTIFAIVLKRKRTLVALLLLSYRFNVTVNVLWLLLMVPWDSLQ